MNTLLTYEDWSPGTDPLLKPFEKDLHERLHEIRAEHVVDKQTLFTQRKFRIDAINTILDKNNLTPKGDILEVGAGDAWCSAYLMDTYAPHISSLSVMECTEHAVTKLIPVTLQATETDLTKIKLILGSFNDIRVASAYDFVFAMGALHHATNLYFTLQQIYKSLKPGGHVVSQEPFMSDSTPNDFYHRYNEEIKDFGIGNTTKNSERTDVFYRKCEYYTAAYHAGFNVDLVTLTEFEDKPSAMVMLLTKPEFPVEPITKWES
ncbi:class I SAM-dependent methyltransferase [Aestuariibacter salexigens]|uniref:class I SAM-dependent methyltransferase n=1 Tax=Aestuariibacter salexigens TaxID=226010 RepID=UPI0004004F37|nr:class I SAM-dependent methyltransferase [Aestuariibacter salexigens]